MRLNRSTEFVFPLMFGGCLALIACGGSSTQCPSGNQCVLSNDAKTSTTTSTTSTECVAGTNREGLSCSAFDAGLSDGDGTSMTTDSIDASTNLPEVAETPASIDTVLPDWTTEAGVGTSEATAWAIDPAHDNEQIGDVVASPLNPAWTLPATGAVYPPLVTHGLAIVAAAESQADIRALDVSTGKVVWGPIDSGKAVWLAYDNGRVFALDSNGHLQAYAAATGQGLWGTLIVEQYSFMSPPVAAGGIVYVDGMGEGGTTLAFDDATGATLWHANTFDGSFGAVALAGGVVYEAEACDVMNTFDAVTGVAGWNHLGPCDGGGGTTPGVAGSMIWERDVSTGNIIFNTSGAVVGSFAGTLAPAFHAGTAFYVSGGSLTAVDIQSSVIKWTFSGDGKLNTPAAVAGGGQVFVGSSAGNVYEIDEAAGTQRSFYNVGAAVSEGSETMSLIIASNHLFVPAGNSLVVF